MTPPVLAGSGVNAKFRAANWEGVKELPPTVLATKLFNEILTIWALIGLGSKY